MLEFMAKRVNIQLTRLKKRNPNAFMFVDEPGLQFLFSAMAGYGDAAARADMEALCCLVNPDGEKTVEEAFKMIKKLSKGLREKGGLL